MKRGHLLGYLRSGQQNPSPCSTHRKSRQQVQDRCERIKGYQRPPVKIGKGGELCRSQMAAPSGRPAAVPEGVTSRLTHSRAEIEVRHSPVCCRGHVSEHKQYLTHYLDAIHFSPSNSGIMHRALGYLKRRSVTTGIIRIISKSWAY